MDFASGSALHFFFPYPYVYQHLRLFGERAGLAASLSLVITRHRGETGRHHITFCPSISPFHFPRPHILQLKVYADNRERLVASPWTCKTSDVSKLPGPGQAQQARIQEVWWQGLLGVRGWSTRKIFRATPFFFRATPFFLKETPFSIWKHPVSIYSFKSNDIAVWLPSLHMEQAFKVCYLGLHIFPHLSLFP